MRRSILARLFAGMTAALLAQGPGHAEEQTACRPNQLGAVACPVARPKPRPILRATTQAIDNVRRKGDPDFKAPVFVPARRTTRLGDTLTDPGRPVSLCQPDTLGNLRCR